jgi:predicted transcriptional regulator of viral defense system
MRIGTRTLSTTQAKVILSVEAEGGQTISLDEVQRRAGVSRSFARKLAHDLVRKGWLQRIRRGTYLVNPSRRGPDALPDRDPLRVGSHLVSPYYFGFATAAELLGLLPQAGTTYYVVTPVRTTAAPPGPSRFRIVHCPTRRFFGTQELRRREEVVRISDRERTLIDLVDRPEYSGGLPGAASALATAKPQLNGSRLARYVERLANRSLAARLGYLLERVRPELPLPPEAVRRLRPRPSAPYVPLGSPREFGRRGPRDERWHIIRNVPDSQLFGEVLVR